MERKKVERWTRPGGVGTVVDSDRLGREILFSSTLSSGPVVFFRKYGHEKTTTVWGYPKGLFMLAPFRQL